MAMVAVAVVAVGVGIYAATRTVEVPGQKLGDIARQTAKEGEPRLIVWGIVRPIGGNLVAVQEPPRIERRKQKSGGKGGGGGSKQTIEVPRRTYAVGICEGPITGIRRAWRNNKLIFDGRPGSEWGARNNGVFLSRFRFYKGGYDQMPDAQLEAVFGVGNVPAMRGTCYMVALDEDLQDTGGAVPQWMFEVERAEGYALTSRPYIAEVDESFGVAGGFVELWRQPLPVAYDDMPQNLYVSAGPVGFEVNDGTFTDSQYLNVFAGVSTINSSQLGMPNPELLSVSAGCSSIKESLLYIARPEYLTTQATCEEIEII